MNNQRGHRFIVALFLLEFFCVLPHARALSCEPTPTKLHIFFTNGILTTEDEAGRALQKLREAFGAEHSGKEILYNLTYNYTDGPFEDLLQSADQVLTQFSSQLLLWLYGSGLVPDWLLAWQQKMMVAEYQINASELTDHVAAYHDALHRAEEVLIIAHSQGNLYANQAYQLMANTEPASFKDSFAVYAVATPANHVAGGSTSMNDYLTNHRDIIQLVPGALPPSRGLFRIATGKFADDVGMVSAHSFLNTYLSTEFDLRDKIVEDIKSNSLHRPAPEFITSCTKSIASITVQQPHYIMTYIPFTAMIENPEREDLKISCTDDIDGWVSVALGGVDCKIVYSAPTLVPLTSYTVYGEVNYFGIPRGSGTVTLSVSSETGKISQSFSVSWDCCDGPIVSGFSSVYVKYSCESSGEHENHCGHWWQF